MKKGLMPVLGITLLEAMSSEVCCLTTPVGIAREIVRDGENAVLMPFNDATAFVERAAALAGSTDERKRLGRNARETILAEMHVGVTSQRVRDVYATAFESFVHRQHGAVRIDVRALASSEPAPRPPVDQNAVPLDGFPSSVHERVKMLESLAWSEHLILYQRQRGEALKMILREWLGHPLSLLPLRVLLRRLLPVSLVARIVMVKHKTDGTRTKGSASDKPIAKSVSSL